MSAFTTMMGQVKDRNWGGTSSSIACEPYISGYSFIKWNIPYNLTKYLNNFSIENDLGITNDQTKTGSDDSSMNNDNIGQQLSSSCMSVTPPGGTLNKVTFNGLGGSKWSVPGSIDYGNTITIKYTEFSGLPILRTHRAWCNMIRDNKSGLTALSSRGTHGTYHKADYSATLLYWTTKPDGVTVEYAAAYSGVFPLKDPMDLFTGDLNSVDKLEIDIDYNVDMVWHEDWVYKMARHEAEQSPYGSSGNTLWSKDGFRYMKQRAIENT